MSSIRLHRCLGKLAYAPLGRGVTYRSMHFSDVYSRLSDISRSGDHTDVPDWGATPPVLGKGLYPGNFSLNAGIPEDILNFRPSADLEGAHTHDTNPLALESVGTVQFMPSSVTGSGNLIRTQLPRTIMLVGRSRTFLYTPTPATPIHDYVRFSDTSVQGTGFPSGVGPIHVFLGVLILDEMAGSHKQQFMGAVVRSVGPQGFSFSLGHIASTLIVPCEIQIMYIAIAQDPGHFTTQVPLDR